MSTRPCSTPCKRLAKEGFDVTFLEPGKDGIITADMIRAALRDDTILVTIMWANNEIGTINEIPQIGALCHEKGVLFHTDATQWGREDAHQCRDRQRRPAVDVQPQDLRPQGRRRPVCPPPQAPASASLRSSMAAGRSEGSARAR